MFMTIKRKKRLLSVIICWLLFSCLLAGCSSSTSKNHATNERHSISEHLSGDIRETTTGNHQLPSFVKNLDPKVGEVYQRVAENTELLDWIPCYCGCGSSVEHKSNRDCFIHEIKANGSIVWDSHGTTCGVCLEIAVEAINLKKQGKSLLEIRKNIDQKYQDQYAQPTLTPMPSK